MRILHAADFHLDSVFSSLPGEKAQQMQKEQEERVFDLVHKAEERKSDILLIAGDLFDLKNTSYRTVQMVKSAFSQMRTPIFIAPGNHDYYHASSPYTAVEWPENVHIFRSPRIERVDMMDICVYGAGFTGRYQEQMLLSGFHAGVNRPSVCLLHGDLDAAGSRYQPVLRKDIEQSGLSYLALGHVHSATGLLYAGKTAYAYPGCPMGRGFDETGEKGIHLVELDEDGNAALEFLPLSGRQYRTLEVPVTGCRDQDEVLENINRMLPADSERHIFRLVFTGQADFDPDIGQIEAALKDRAFHLSVRSRVSKKAGLWVLRGDASLAGRLADRAFSAYEQAETEADSEKIRMAAEYITAAVRGIPTDEWGGVRE